MCCSVCLQSVRLSDLRGRQFFSGLSSELQPLPSESAGPELQSSRRLRSEATVSGTGGSKLETGHSQVQTLMNKMEIFMLEVLKENISQN